MRFSATGSTGYTTEEVWQLLGQFGRLSPGVVLVGGQALAFWAGYRVDVLKAISAKSIPSDQFRNRRWPQLQREVAQRRAALRRLIGQAGRASGVAKPGLKRKV